MMSTKFLLISRSALWISSGAGWLGSFCSIHSHACRSARSASSREVMAPAGIAAPTAARARRGRFSGVGSAGLRNARSFGNPLQQLAHRHEVRPLGGQALFKHGGDALQGLEAGLHPAGQVGGSGDLRGHGLQHTVFRRHGFARQRLRTAQRQFECAHPQAAARSVEGGGAQVGHAGIGMHQRQQRAQARGRVVVVAGVELRMHVLPMPLQQAPNHLEALDRAAQPAQASARAHQPHGDAAGRVCARQAAWPARARPPSRAPAPR